MGKRTDPRARRSPPRRPGLMRIKPLWLRQKLYSAIYQPAAGSRHELYRDVPLEFAPDVAVDLMPSDVSHQSLAYLGFYELAVTRVVARLREGGGLLVDVGANYGYYSCLWASAGTANRAIAYEASPPNCAALRANILKNSLETRIRVHEVAVGERAGQTWFSPGPAEQSGWGGVVRARQEGTYEVPVVTLDETLSLDPEAVIEILKVDVEGADALVLRGASNLLEQARIRNVLFEENLPRMATLDVEPGTSAGVLRRHGYKVREISEGEFHATRS